MTYPENNKIPERQEQKLSIDELITKFERKHIAHPATLAKSFKNKAEFRQWCEEGSKADLKATLKEFEKAELYEHCAVINEVLKRNKL